MLPKPLYLERWLTWLARFLGRSRLLAPLLIWIHRRLFVVHLEEAEPSYPSGYPTFAAYFARSLKPDARPMPADPKAVIAPCDGTLLAHGAITNDTLVQAKQHTYSLGALICGPNHAFINGHYLTFYLGPADYHRVHAPADMRVLGTQYVGGRLFSVKGASQQTVSHLFTRNERLIIYGQTAFGPLLMVLVGAQLVSGIHTHWQPAGYRVPGAYEALADHAQPHFCRGEEMAHFAFGSTVILLLPSEVAKLHARQSNTAIRLGDPVGHLL